MEKGRFIVYTGRNIPKKIYNKIIDLDAEIFNEDADEFQSDTSMPKDTLMSYLKKNILTTTVIYDRQQDKAVAYLQAFPLTQEFFESYKKGEKSFQDITADVIEGGSSNNPLNLYVWSVGISKEFRGKVINDIDGEVDGKKMYKVLLAEFVNSLINITKQGSQIENIICEGVSKKGQALAMTISGGNIVHEDKEQDFLLCASKFDINNFKGLVEDDLIKKFNDIKNVQNRNSGLGNNINKLTEKDNYYSKFKN